MEATHFHRQPSTGISFDRESKKLTIYFDHKEIGITQRTSLQHPIVRAEAPRGTLYKLSLQLRSARKIAENADLVPLLLYVPFPVIFGHEEPLLHPVVLILSATCYLLALHCFIKVGLSRSIAKND